MKKNISGFISLLIFALLFTGLKPDEREGANKSLATNDFIPVWNNIYLYKDICNVYVLKSGESALLIDTGSGAIINHLQKIGINKIDWILHTHYHRDQTAGSVILKNIGAKIAVGESDSVILNRREKAPPFKIPEKYLLNGELPGWGKRFAPFQSVKTDKKFTDGEEFTWNQYKIKIINTPGHTEGSISFLVKVDGKKLCFTGDLIMKGGHIRDLYSMQWEYLKNPGIDASIASLAKLDEINADLLLPSHGEIINTPEEDVKLLDLRLKKVNDLLTYKHAGRWNWSQLVQVSDHVIQDGGSTSQIILSDTGNALLFDCGPGFLQDRLPELKAKYGVKKIDVIIPSHWHYDHVDGINEVVKAEGAEVWVWEGLAEHLKYPEHFPTTCWTGKSIKPDRILKENEKFTWQGYQFKVYHHPVHTEQQMGLYAKIDGLDIYMVADGTGLSKDGYIRCPIHCYNGISLSTGLIKTAQSLYSANPYVCLPAHSNVFAVNPNDKDEFLEWTTETTDAIGALLPPHLTDLSFDPYCASFYPARVHLKAGGEKDIILRIKNYTKRPISGKYLIKEYGDLVVDDNLIEYELQPGETKDFQVEVKCKNSAEKGIHILTADIEYDNSIFGEYPQAYIEIDE